MTSRKEILIKDTDLKRNLKNKRILTTLILKTGNSQTRLICITHTSHMSISTEFKHNLGERWSKDVSRHFTKREM